jgi:anti-anti-sigma factor
MKLSSLDSNTGLIALDRILNADSEKVLISLVTDAAKQGTKSIIIDFRPLDHLNSAGASILVKLAVAAKLQQIRPFAYGLNKRYRDIFNLTGLSENIKVLGDVPDNAGVIDAVAFNKLKEPEGEKGKQDDSGWAPNTGRLRVTENPEEAMNKNVDGRHTVGPLQGFGPMWQKTYLLPIKKAGLQPGDVIKTMKQHFPEFQPPQNRFYPSSKGIATGEIVLIDSSTPGGIVSTGVLVLYADDLSFTLITPQGHPEAGWVTFSARRSEDAVEMQIQGLARAADPLYELAFRIAGSKFQETIWRHVLSSFAAYLEIEADVSVVKTCIGSNLQWTKTGNLWYNAQVRSLPYNIIRLFSRRRQPHSETDRKNAGK